MTLPSRSNYQVTSNMEKKKKVKENENKKEADKLKNEKLMFYNFFWERKVDEEISKRYSIIQILEAGLKFATSISLSKRLITKFSQRVYGSVDLENQKGIANCGAFMQSILMLILQNLDIIFSSSKSDIEKSLKYDPQILSLNWFPNPFEPQQTTPEQNNLSSVWTQEQMEWWLKNKKEKRLRQDIL